MEKIFFFFSEYFWCVQSFLEKQQRLRDVLVFPKDGSPNRCSQKEITGQPD